MLRFVYDHTNYTSLLKDFAAFLNAEVTGNQLNFPPHFAEGYAKALQLPNGLHAALYNCTIKQPFYFSRKRSHEEYYTLRFEIANVADKVMVKVGDSYEQHSAHVRAAVLLSSSLFDFAYMVQAGTVVKGLSIFFSPAWMSKYLGIENTDDVLKKYLALKTAAFNFEPMDADYRKRVDEIFNANPGHPLYNAQVENRIMMLTERFFKRLYTRAGELEDLQITNQDIHRIMEAESMLVKDFAAVPLTIQQIADKVSMSVSKLKKDFKLVYGFPVYEYYQKHRMERAKELLLSGDYSIKEVGYKVGYQNLSNFSQAFRKQFNVLPSELAK
ncbi:MAG: helix-turn-helix transcriptional regulator [Chitinophagaceae bacterium]|nr:helix-turn-helix transcriptional regulator [Chitinophagaceae bacterium]